MELKVEKRILEADPNDDLDNDIGSAIKAKVPRINKVTDVLTDGKTTSENKEVWEKSGGTLNIKKGSLVVVNKKSTQNTNIETKVTTSSVSTSSSAPSSTTLSLSSLGLGLLGNYSHSEESDGESQTWCVYACCFAQTIQ